MSNELSTTDALPAISTDSLISIANKAEARIDAVKKIKALSLRVTNHQDWVDQNGKPYLQTSGGEKIARLFGISWTVEEPRTQQDGDEGHYMVTYKGVFALGNASIECIGTRSSKDGFFKKYEKGGYVEGKYSQGKEMPAGAIDIGDVVKSAYTNLIGNGITRLLGIRNLTYDDLAESGIDVSQITKVEYKSKVKSPQSKSSQAVINQKGCASESAKNDVGIMIGVENVTMSNGEKDGKAWTKYHIKDTSGGDWTTFDKKIAEDAKKAKESGECVSIKTETKGKYTNIVALTTTKVEGIEAGEDEMSEAEFSKIAEEAAKGLDL